MKESGCVLVRRGFTGPDSSDPANTYANFETDERERLFVQRGLSNAAKIRDSGAHRIAL